MSKHLNTTLVLPTHHPIYPVSSINVLIYTPLGRLVPVYIDFKSTLQAAIAVSRYLFHYCFTPDVYKHVMGLGKFHI